MERKCFSCGNFDAYYNKGYCCFLKTDCGHCCKRNETVKKHGTCEEWKSRYYSNTIKRGAVIEGLEEALTKINAIKMILDEKSEEHNLKIKK